MKRKKSLWFIILLTLILTIGSVAYAAPDLDTIQTESSGQRRYDILDTLTYGVYFDGSQVQCFASGFAGHAEKFVMSGMLQKKISNGTYDLVRSWDEETQYGKSCEWNKFCTAAGDGEYLFTFYIDIYDGEKWEYLTFTKHANRTPNNH